MGVDWKHRTRVYRFGVRWTWKCHRPMCGEGSSRLTWTQQDAYAAAVAHTTEHGAYPIYPAISDIEADAAGLEED